VLAVSTDPAHSLGDALGVALGAVPIPIPTRRGELLAAELDAPGALAAWLAEHRAALETLAERGTWLDRDDVRRLLDLSLPGVDELIGLVELVRLAGAASCEEVVVDTAPTGHTLRLLAMPEELRRLAGALDRLQTRHRIVAESLGGAWHPDRSDALIDEIEGQGREIEDLLRDPERTAFHWVLLPESLSVAETRDGVRALEEAGIAVPELIVNRMATASDTPCPMCDARRWAEQEAVNELRVSFPGRAVRFLPELDREPRGLPALRRIAKSPLPQPLPRAYPHPPPRAGEGRPHPQHNAKVPPLPFGVEGRRDARERGLGGEGLLFFGGKGGVGKTTCAAAAALLLAERRPGERILLLSTDPAHSLSDVLDVPLGDDERPVPGAPPNLRARELDAARTFADWRARHLDAVEGWLEEAGGGVAEGEREAWRDLLDLAPPGLDELSAVSALLDALSGAPDAAAYDLVVVDTAPTGHTLRLLETPAALLAWVQALLSLMLKYREVAGLGSLAAELVELSRGLRHLGELLRDPVRTGFVVVTRAAELPRRETVRLLAELERLGLAVPAVLVDAVIPAGCARCDRAVKSQELEIRRLRREAGAVGEMRRSCAIIRAPAVFPPPRGVQALADWGRTWETGAE
jgi:arsenite/tail-anchored protein-transporting ATPase